MNNEQRSHVSVDPSCPECGCMITVLTKTKAIKLMHDGHEHHASKQLRRCTECGHSFPWIRIKERVSRGSKRRVTGAWAEKQ